MPLAAARYGLSAPLLLLLLGLDAVFAPRHTLALVHGGIVASESVVISPQSRFASASPASVNSHQSRVDCGRYGLGRQK
jgi:hypothetical protein